MIRFLPALLAACIWTTPQAPPPSTATTSEPTTTAQPLAGGGAVYAIDRHELLRVMRASSSSTRVYNIWATWCAPCVAEMPALEAFAEANPQIELWYVNTDHPKVADKQLERFVVKHGLDDRRHLRQQAGESDLTASLTDFPGVLPATYVISSSGQTLQVFRGRVDEAALASVITPEA